MADEPVLDGYWAQYFSTWDEWDNTIDWLFPSGVAVAGVDLEPSRLKELGRFSPNTYLSIAVAAAVKQGLGQDRVQALRDFFGVVDPLEYQAKTKRRGGGGDFGASFIDALDTALPDLGGLMAQVVINRGYRVTLKSRVGSQQVVNVLHFLGNAAGLEKDAAQAMFTFWKSLQGGYTLLGNNSMTFEGVEAVDLSSINGGIWWEADGTAYTSSLQLATAGAAALVQLNGQTRNRNSRGRIYLGPLREADLQGDGRTLVSTTKNRVSGIVNDMRTAMTAEGFDLQVLSRATSTMYPVTLVRVADIIATQRRRIRS